MIALAKAAMGTCVGTRTTCTELQLRGSHFTWFYLHPGARVTTNYKDVFGQHSPCPWDLDTIEMILQRPWGSSWVSEWMAAALWLWRVSETWGSVFTRSIGTITCAALFIKPQDPWPEVHSGRVMC